MHFISGRHFQSLRGVGRTNRLVPDRFAVLKLCDRSPAPLLPMTLDPGLQRLGCRLIAQAVSRRIDAMHWNQKAIIADRKFYDRAGPMNFYSGYRVHNYHFAAYGAMFLGQYAPAIAAADELIETMPEAMLRIPSPPMADFFESYVSIRQHVLVRFGKWREIIAQDLPADRDLYCNTVAMIHYAKGVAHAALGDVSAEEGEQARFREAAKLVPRSRQIHNVLCVQLLAIAEEMLVSAQPAWSTDPPRRMARMAWCALMPRRAAVPTTDLMVANRSAPQLERKPPVTLR